MKVKQIILKKKVVEHKSIPLEKPKLRALKKTGKTMTTARM